MSQAFKDFWFWFWVEFISFMLVVANGRAYVQGNYGWTIATDMIIQLQIFIIGKKFIADAERLGFWACAGSVLGGGLGSCFAIFVTKMVYGK